VTAGLLKLEAKAYIGVRLRDDSKAERARGERELRAILETHGIKVEDYRFRLIRAWDVGLKESVVSLDAYPKEHLLREG